MTNFKNADEFKSAVLEAGAEEVYEDGSQEFQVYEDDGHYFINQFGLRACFDSWKGQDSTRREFNKEVNQTLKALGYDYKYNETGIV